MCVVSYCVNMVILCVVYIWKAGLTQRRNCSCFLPANENVDRITIFMPNRSCPTYSHTDQSNGDHKQPSHNTVIHVQYMYIMQALKHGDLVTSGEFVTSYNSLCPDSRTDTLFDMRYSKFSASVCTL